MGNLGLCFSTSEKEDIKGKWNAIIYIGKKFPHTFIAGLQKRFRANSDRPVEATKFVTLKEKL